MDIVGTTKFKLLLKTRTRQHSHVHGALMPIKCCLLDYVTLLRHFRELSLVFFADLIHDCVEVYMDDFTVYGNTFEEALSNLEKVLIRCQESNLSLSHEKCKMLLTEGIVLGHHLSAEGIKVDPAKLR
jgi:hypothetical protein